MTLLDYYFYFFTFLVVVYSGALIWEAFFSKKEASKEPQPPFYCLSTQYEKVDDFCDPFSPYYRSLCSTEFLNSGGELRHFEDSWEWLEGSSVSQPEFFSLELYQNNFSHNYYHNDYGDYWDSYDSFDPFYNDFC